MQFSKNDMVSPIGQLGWSGVCVDISLAAKERNRIRVAGRVPAGIAPMLRSVI
jgi:hypothetical protein